ncbi:MAG: hypothetical protein Q7T00_10615 [Rugosibacter sp.]|jgi:citronellol/citronellal dehydrogenase|nr:hypothetical protein [Rugosibacter sp.]
MEYSMKYQSVFRPGLFAGQIILVTGGDSGLSRCTSHKLAGAGATVTFLAAQPKSQAVQDE